MEIILNPLDPKSVADARRKLTAYRKKLPAKCAELSRRLAELGCNIADLTFSSAVYDLEVKYKMPIEPTNIVVSYEASERDGKVIYTVHADGKAVAFVEFGAGVYYNGGGDPYHDTRPEGIVGIGEYGKGKGKQWSWGFYGDDGEVYVTCGTPEQPGMWIAARNMRSNIEEIAREVFGT